MQEISSCRTCGSESSPGMDELGLCPGCLLRLVAGDSQASGEGPKGDPDEIEPVLSLEERAYRSRGLDIIGRLGEGGMGIVYEAEEPALNRRVALKVLREEHRDNPAIRRQFIEEAQVGGRLQHPGTVPVYAIGEIDGLPFFSMRLLDGRPFAESLRRGADPSWSIGVFLQVCQALAYAHDQGIIHRDLKPSNIMVGDFGEAQLVDWGVARVVSDSPGESTDAFESPSFMAPGRRAGVAGTPAYMAPEQASGDLAAQDRRADVFGLGAILCEILTGAPPHRGETRDEILRKAREGDLGEALARIDASDAAEDLKALARDCLAADPAARPPHAGEVGARVLRYQSLVQQRLKDAESAQIRTTIRAAEERRRWALSVALLGVCAIAGFGWYAERARKSREVSETIRSVRDSIHEAASLRERGRNLDSRSAFRKAEGLLARSQPDVRDRFARPLADLAMLARLDDIRQSPSQLGPGRLLPAGSSAGYDDAFDAYGIDVPAGPDDRTASRIRASAIRTELVSAIDDWARITPDPAARKRLHAISEAADPEPEGPAGRLRRAMAKSDRAELSKLAQSVSGANLPASVLASLGAALREQKATRESADVLRSAQLAHPDDFWINLELSTTLMALDPGRRDESLAYRTAALALSRNNPAVHFYQAAALQNSNLLDAAVVAYGEAIRLRPDYPEAYCNLGNTLTSQRKFDEAEAAFRTAIRLRPDYALAYFNLGYALDERGKYAESFDAYAQAARHREGYAEALCNQGLAAYRLGRFAEAIPPFERGLALTAGGAPLRPMFEKMLAIARNLSALEPLLGRPLDAKTTAELPVADLIGLARLCAWPNRGRNADAARLYEQAFSRQPALAEDLEVGDRYAAAGSAAMAGAGPGSDRAEDTERSHWRQRALEWLRADLERRRGQLERADAAGRRDVAMRLAYWSRDPNLAGVRGTDAIARLPESEREGWRSLWGDIAQLVSGGSPARP